MRLVAECFKMIAAEYPSDFLHFIRHMPLQAEPEVLGDIDAFDVMLPSVLLAGSSHRCPKGIWDDRLRLYSRKVDGGVEPVDLNAGRGTPTLNRMNTESMRDIPEVSEASPVVSPSDTPRKFRPQKSWRASGRGSGSRLDEDTQSRIEVEELKPAFGRRSAIGDNLGKEAIKMGYHKTSKGGLQAYRVPIEHFAGLLTDDLSNEDILSDHRRSTSILQLVVNAVGQTSDYSVFDSSIMAYIIDFKWNGFARSSFRSDLLLYICHAAMTVAFNLRASLTLYDPDWPGGRITLNDIVGAPGSRFPGQPYVFLLFGLGWTFFFAIWSLFTEIRQMRNGFHAYITDHYNICDLVNIFGQVTINVLFLCRDVAPDAMLTYDSVSISQYALDKNASEHSQDIADRAHTKILAGRMLRAGGSGAGESDEDGMTFYKPQTFINIQAIVCLFVCLRMFYYFRGNLKLSALSHTVSKIVVEIYPVIMLLLIFVLSFSFAAMLLLQHELKEEKHPQVKATTSHTPYASAHP